MKRQLFMRREFMSRMSKDETVVFFQLLRIVNSLEFWIRLMGVVPKEKDEVFEVRNQIELLFAMICSYKESIKIFDNELGVILLNMDLSEDSIQKIKEYQNWLAGYDTDEYLKVVSEIRNCIRFHFRDVIYNEVIHDGECSKDICIGYATGDQCRDFYFIEPYTAELQHIAKLVPMEIEEGQKQIDWIFERSSIEIDKFRRLLRQIICEILKGNTYLKNVQE